ASRARTPEGRATSLLPAARRCERRRSINVRYVVEVVQKTVAAWVEDKAPRLGAALAYYSCSAFTLARAARRRRTGRLPRSWSCFCGSTTWRRTCFSGLRNNCLNNFYFRGEIV